MSGFFCCSVFFAIILVNNALVIPKSDGPLKRVHDKLLSDEEHYQQETFHNADYDHEAFLGEKEAKTFDELSPEESKRRLGIIVDKIDTDKDSFVSLQELKEWIQHTQRKYIKEDSVRQWRNWNPYDKPELTWEAYIKNSYGSVEAYDKTELTWEEYKKNSYGYVEEQEAGDTYGYKEMVERDLRRWEKADLDNSGSLNKLEFMDFVHPEESSHMKDVIVLETMEDIDRNRDGKISLEEYIDNDVESEPSWVQSEREQFINFRDKDKNGFMEFNEVRDWILPSGYDNSAAEANHLIYESDVDRDNQLSKEEILDKFDLFVGSQATDFGEALVRHDEF